MSFQPQKISDLTNQLMISTPTISRGDYLYIFGRNPLLSLAEIISLYNNEEKAPNILALTEKGAVIKGPNSIDIHKSGTILRKSVIIGRVPLKLAEISKVFPSFLEEILYNRVFLEEKCSWTVSTYNLPPNSTAKPYKDHLHMLIKKGIKKLGIRRAFYITGQELENVAPRRLKRKQVLELGMEIVLFFYEESILIGLTEQVLNIDGFAARDDQRPFTRPLLLLGLALGRAMINLTTLGTKSRQSQIYDPFCGMGSIVGEAYCLGYEAYGSDIDTTCVSQAQANLKWLSQQTQFHDQPAAFSPDHIFPLDITQPTTSNIPQFTGAIVTEPNLLTPQSDYPTLPEARVMMGQFSDNYYQYFHGISRLLQKGQVGVMIFPRIRTNQDTRLPFDYGKLFTHFGFSVVKFPVNNLRIPAIFVHAWKKHIIEREIVVFIKK